MRLEAYRPKLTYPIPARGGSMVRLPSEFDPIDYLVERKFPLLRVALIPVSISSPSRPPRIDRAKIQGEAKKYRTELETLPRDDLKALLKSERAKELAERQEKAAKEEAARFFNQPYSTGDFEHWSKAQYWSIDEAVALSLGKAPEHVNWSSVSPMVSYSPFANRYQRVRDLALRAVAWQALYDPILPALFLDWTRKNDLPFPEDLASRVTARHGNVVNWRLLYTKLKEDSEREIAELRAAVANVADRPASNEPRATSNQSDSGATRERESLLKLFIVAAVRKYRFDPHATRSETVSRIKRDVEDCGLSLDDATILKYLRQGAELLSPKENK
ncbi:MAG: hypothetical protein KDK08_02540 [Rhizobiaceae bacterium]|nr:hypothetical protein [Rhizobiaceae bacterium]